MIVILDDGSDIEIEEESLSKDNQTIVNNLIGKFEINTEVIVVKPYLPVRVCTTAAAYFRPQEAQVIMVRIICSFHRYSSSLGS